MKKNGSAQSTRTQEDSGRADDLGTSKTEWTISGGGRRLLTPDEKTYRAKIRFLSRLKTHLASVDRRSKPRLESITATFPEPIFRAAIFGAASHLADYAANGESEGAWLAIDLSGTRPHWHGIVLTSRSPNELRRRWSHLTGAERREAMVLNAIRGSTPSGGDEKVSWKSNKMLRKNLNYVVHYALKDIDHDVDPELRVVATGSLKTPWVEALQGGDDVTTELPILQNSIGVSVRHAEPTVAEEVDAAERRPCANFKRCGGVDPVEPDHLGVGGRSPVLPG